MIRKFQNGCGDYRLFFCAIFQWSIVLKSSGSLSFEANSLSFFFKIVEFWQNSLSLRKMSLSFEKSPWVQEKKVAFNEVSCQKQGSISVLLHELKVDWYHIKLRPVEFSTQIGKIALLGWVLRGNWWKKLRYVEFLHQNCLEFFQGLSFFLLEFWKNAQKKPGIAGTRRGKW